MIQSKLAIIKAFCTSHSDPEIIKKYSKYFKEGYDGYGIDQKVFEKQWAEWISSWKAKMTIDDYLDLGDQLIGGKLEEQSLAIVFLKSERPNYTKETFRRIANWFSLGINNWATTDVLCMLVLAGFLEDQVIDLNDLKTWNNADSEWQRRAVPVTLVELLKSNLRTEDALNTIEPLMLDKSEYVQKGLGTLLRELWKQQANEIEDFLYQWKDQSPRLIFQYATEKMDKEYRKKFRRKK